MAETRVPIDSQALALRQASHALWLATLSLMTAFMHNQAPAHRLLLARRIAANLHTLGRQECMADRSRQTFDRLSARWWARAECLALQAQPERAQQGPSLAAWLRLR
ncbi:hypothetical protein [uncultured Ramlibacter sp.]|mgnify:CR=1 FL=1|uniref:hypothetical protein n=1 Tax=uncultured Ramlibacter sp. TaxID=260755 RepID=UPI0026046948|nr:hypothetical protein [uncultured Ramlibacter sp.]